jgi:hypothetical protein
LSLFYGKNPGIDLPENSFLFTLQGSRFKKRFSGLPEAIDNKKMLA